MPCQPAWPRCSGRSAFSNTGQTVVTSNPGPLGIPAGIGGRGQAAFILRGHLTRPGFLILFSQDDSGCVRICEVEPSQVEISRAKTASCERGCSPALAHSELYR